MNPFTAHDVCRGPAGGSCHGRDTGTPAEVRAALSREHRDRSLQRHVRRFTGQLLTLYQIPAHETTLVPWLTGQPCSNNAQALADWVRAQLTDTNVPVVDLPPTSQTIELANRLQRLLFAIEDSLR